jgi:hypothetical protein
MRKTVLAGLLTLALGIGLLVPRLALASIGDQFSFMGQNFLVVGIVNISGDDGNPAVFELLGGGGTVFVGIGGGD